MRLALIADIHGNSIALDAVLRDAADQGVEGCCFLGDLVDGFDPSGVLSRAIKTYINVTCRDNVVI